jgi:hypothetical protein
VHGVAPYAVDADHGRRLWDLPEDLLTQAG